MNERLPQIRDLTKKGELPRPEFPRGGLALQLAITIANNALADQLPNSQQRMNKPHILQLYEIQQIERSAILGTQFLNILQNSDINSTSIRNRIRETTQVSKELPIFWNVDPLEFYLDDKKMQDLKSPAEKHRIESAVGLAICFAYAATHAEPIIQKVPEDLKPRVKAIVKDRMTDLAMSLMPDYAKADDMKNEKIPPETLVYQIAHEILARKVIEEQISQLLETDNARFVLQ